MFLEFLDVLQQRFSVLKHQALLTLSLFLLTLGIALQWNIAPAEATSIYAIPRVSAGEKTWVVDEAKLLSRLTYNQLETQLTQLAQQTGIELRFVTFRRLDYGETIQTFADKLFENWFPDEEVQTGEAIFVVDALTNTGGFHLGPSAAERVSEEAIASIATETFLDPLREGNKYNQALVDVVNRLGAILRGEPDPGPPDMSASFQAESSFATAEETKESNATAIVIILLIIATVVPMLTYFVYVR